MIIVFTISSYFIFKEINVESLKVDRWSVITSFWDNYFDNKYVYFAKSNMDNPPGPMPFYFILSLPFYLIKETGYLSIVGLILFYVIIKCKKTKIHIRTTLLLLIISSVFFLWEVTCRSNIFFNSSLLLLVLTFYFKNNQHGNLPLFFSGILIGLTLSTRNVLIIPFIIAFVYEIKTKSINLKQLFILIVSTSISFIVTFLPFIINHFEDFQITNPFMTQSSGLMPFWMTLIFIFISLIFGKICKSRNDIYFYSGLNLFLTILGYFLFHFYSDGFYNSFFESKADVSYFILCIPFCLFYLSHKTDN